MEWAGIAVMLIIFCVIVVRDARKDTEYQESFLKAAEKLGLSSMFPEQDGRQSLSDPSEKWKEGLWEAFSKFSVPKDHFPFRGPAMKGVIEGWEVVFCNTLYSSNPADSHTGPGSRIVLSATALSNPSRTLPTFRSGPKRDNFENPTQYRFTDTALTRLWDLRRNGWTAECDGRWLLIYGTQGPRRKMTPEALANHARSTLDLANSISTARAASASPVIGLH